MRITRLRLAGFKSFVERAEVPIEPGLTGVVGPNGCGKSNLLEALRWVMGEASAKSMRGAGMDDVIFAGTTTRPARDFAEVAMTVERDGEQSEVVRRIERGAGSAYRIDGRDVRAKDVALLFADAATGAHSPALVSQNRIGAVIAARPAERRAMLEEAAGIAGLHVRRKDAETRLRGTEANLQRLDEVIADQAARAALLRRQARQAERYRALSERIRVAEARMIHARWREAAEAAYAARVEAGSAEATVGAATIRQEEADTARQRATDALAEARAASVALRETASEAGHRLSTLRLEHANVTARLEGLNAAARRVETDRAGESQLAEEAARATNALGAEAQRLGREVAEAEARLPTRDAEVAEAERVLRDAEVELAQGLAAQAAEAADVRIGRAAVQAADGRVERAARDRARLEAESARIGDAAPLLAEQAACSARADAAREAAENARAARSNADADERAGQQRRDDVEAARATAKAERSALEAEAAALEKALRTSMQNRLIDHVRVTPGYERALAAALGDDLEAGIDTASPRRWAGAEPMPNDPPLPAGCEPLATRVTAPAALTRRLAQVGVAECDEGQALAVGQRLVTREGRLRRWDGLVADAGAAAAAERLERRNRLEAIATALPGVVRATEAAEAALREVEERIAQARVRSRAAAAALDQAEGALREALRGEQRAASAVERLAGQRSDLDMRRERVEADLHDARAEAARAAATLAALPDGAETRAHVAMLEGEAARARAAVAERRGGRAALAGAISADRERLAAAQAEIRGWKARAGEAVRRIAELERRQAEAACEIERLAERPAELATTLAASEEAARVARIDAERAAQSERAAEDALRLAEAAARAAAEALAAAREVRAGAAARAEAQDLRRVEMGRISGERFECPAPLLPERVGFDAADVGAPAAESARHEQLSAERERIGPVNLVAATELAEIEGAQAESVAGRDELIEAVHRLRGSIGTLNREGRQRLLAAFEAVDGHFRRLFTTLFDGGQAHLELVDSDDPLEAGLEIMAQPPGKKLQSLTLLSGGEQALTAVALIFGLFLTNPAPICVLDEVDAPLDDANIERFCDLLDRMARETDTRYLIVTHNAVTMSRMHRLFGVTMIERGVSRLVSVDLGGATELLAAE